MMRILVIFWVSANKLILLLIVCTSRMVSPFDVTNYASLKVHRGSRLLGSCMVEVWVDIWAEIRL